jgi:hypothetical protein
VILHNLVEEEESKEGPLARIHADSDSSAVS